MRLYNTLTRKLEEFQPIDANNIGVYVCGVTPYDDSHIGHARSAVVFDVLFRTLRHVFGAGHVTYVKNFTDIDDKIIIRAMELGIQPTELSSRYIEAYRREMDILHVLQPTYEPKVSENIAGIITMIDALIGNGNAYVTESGDVMFRVSTFPRFGELARRDLGQEKHGARVTVDAEKEAPEDFVLWKANAKSATKLEEAFEPTAFSAKRFDAPGRPGWHIECSVMSKRFLGDTFDIHGGGEDLIFPHHSCEIAQSEALLSGNQPMARIWMHNAFVTVEGKKMSKSLGNFTTIQDTLSEFEPEAVRLWLLQTHYRKPVDYTKEALKSSSHAINRLRNIVRDWPEAVDVPVSDPQDESQSLYGLRPGDPVGLVMDFWKAIFDDLNTSEALGVVWRLVIDEHTSLEKKSRILSKMDEVLGLNLAAYFGKPLEVPPAVQELVAAREAARTAKNWVESDRLRDEIAKLGFTVEDTANGAHVKAR